MLYIACAGLLAMLPGASYGQPDTLRSETTGKIAPGAPIAPFGDTLFWIYSGIGGIPIEKRAGFIVENILALEDDPFYTPDSLKVVAAAEHYNVVYNGKVIMSVMEESARMLGYEPMLLATEYRDGIVTAIREKRADNFWGRFLKRIGLGILLLAVTYFVVKYLNVLCRNARRLLLNKKNKTIKKLYYLFGADRQIRMATALLRIIRFILVALVLYICLLLFFRLFPSTRWLSDTLIGYILSPLKSVLIAIRDYIPNLFAIIVIVAIFLGVIRVIRFLAGRVGSGTITIKGFYPDWASSTFNIIRVILLVFMFIMIFPHLPNSDSKIFQGVSVFVGLLLSLGSTSLIGNLISGLVITYMRPFKVGDRIKMGDNLGNVIEKNSLVTRIRTVKNEVVTIPNANIMASQTINYTHSAEAYGLILHAVVTMGYEVSWRTMHALLIEAGLKTQHVLPDPKPFVNQVALDDFYVQYEINIYTRNADEMTAIYSDLNKNIQDIFNREGIELLAPHIYAHRGAGGVAIPKEFVKPASAKAPAFDVNVQSVKGKRVQGEGYRVKGKR
jgi:small-conductance mechanosensitive channel